MTQISNNPRKLETTRATKNKSSDKTLSMFKKKKPAPVDVGSLVKKVFIGVLTVCSPLDHTLTFCAQQRQQPPQTKQSSYTRGWLTDYNALRKEETFAEGVFLRHSRTNAGRVVFSLSELPQGACAHRSIFGCAWCGAERRSSIASAVYCANFANRTIGDVWLTANNTPLERVSASEVKIGDHTVQVWLSTALLVGA